MEFVALKFTLPAGTVFDEAVVIPCATLRPETVFGATNPADMLVIDGKPGRYLYDEGPGRWIFETGDFCRNHCANLRLSFITGMPLRLL